MSDEVVLDPGIGLGTLVVLAGILILIRRSDKRDSQRWADREADRQAEKLATANNYKEKLKEIDKYKNQDVDIIVKNDYVGTTRGGKKSIKMKVDDVDMYVHDEEGVNYAKNANGMDKNSPIRAVKKTLSERKSEAEYMRINTIEDAINDPNLPEDIRKHFRSIIASNDDGDLYNNY